MEASDRATKGARALLFCGDSHLRAPSFAADQGWFLPCATEFCLIGGATAIGLRHPTSRTQALVEFRRLLLPFNPAIMPIFQLGEVDCGFVAWHRAQQYGESVDAQIAAAIDAYVAFVTEMAEAGYHDLIVTSAILPTIRDGQLEGEVAHLRRTVTATQIERTSLTIDYNNRLAAEVRRRGLSFLDFTDQLLNRDTGLIHERFRHPNPADHHLRDDLGGRMWADGIKAFITARGSGRGC